MLLAKTLKVHFVGIGGIGMSGIAEVLLRLGWAVSGSDLRPSPVLERLAALGARIDIGHKAHQVGDAGVVVISSAVSPQNPEVTAARERRIPVIPRAEMLAELMRLKFGIAVAGMHGKTTTTSMIATLLAAAQLDPTVVVGGRLDTMGSNARLGASEYLVAEADESDRSFLKLSPIIAVITNLDREHLDCYADLEDIQRAFAEFANRVPFYGGVVICTEEEPARALLPLLKRQVLSYGERPEAGVQILDLRLETRRTRFRLELSESAAPALGRASLPRDLGTFELIVPGRHNVLNATAAVTVGLMLGRDLEVLRTSLAEFHGVDRRFQFKGEVAGVAVIDDYGHHPTEIAATIAAARQRSYTRVLMLFQPHRYTRTYHLQEEFAAALRGVDRGFLLDIYSAGEEPIPGVDSRSLVERLRASGAAVEYVPSVEEAVARIAQAARPGDVILTQGAGNVSALGDKILQALRGLPDAAQSPAAAQLA